MSPATHRPGYKVEWCAALPVKMRLAGWEEAACVWAYAYSYHVRHVYTGNAWRNYARDVDDWIAKTQPRPMLSSLTPYRFPTRSGVGFINDRVAIHDTVHQLKKEFSL